MKTVYLDTETMGLCDPLLSIQWKIEDQQPKLAQVWFQPVKDTLSIIEWLMGQRLVIWNASFDIFQLNKWYNIFKAYSKHSMGIPNPRDINECFEENRQYCLKPKEIIDLMLLCKKGKFQHLMRQKPFIFKRVPEEFADNLINNLINTIHKPIGIKWHTIKSKTKKPGYVDIQLVAKGSFQLKSILAVIRREKDMLTRAKDVFRHTKIAPKWRPWGGKWWDQIYPMNQSQKRYALDDVEYLREIHAYLGEIEQDTDSVIAAMNGANYWKGFSIDKQKCKEKFEECQDCFNVPTAPAAVQKYLNIQGSTAAKVLQASKDPKAKEVIRARKQKKLIKVLEYLVKADGLFVSMKAVGTLTNRQSGGHEETEHKAAEGSINLQGQDRTAREIYSLAYDGELLSGGDFSGFEVAIVDALLKDKQLHEDLLSGKKLHGLWAETVYQLLYDQVLEEHHQGVRDASGKTKYERAKNSVFADFYGAQLPKMAETLNLPIQEVEAGRKKWHERYPKIADLMKRVERDYQFIREDYSFNEIKPFVESFLGFKRHFTLEIAITNGIKSLLESLPWEAEGEYFRFTKWQTLKGCMKSLLFGALFSIQGRVQRVAGNHQIQSPGAEITKKLQERIWALQPGGIHPWKVRIINIHDELQCCHAPELFGAIESAVQSFIEEYRKHVPLLKMEWNCNMEAWSH